MKETKKQLEDMCRETKNIIDADKLLKRSTTDKIFTEAYEQAMPEHGEGWDSFADRIKIAMQEMEDLLRDAVDHIDRSTVAGVSLQEKIETLLE